MSRVLVLAMIIGLLAPAASFAAGGATHSGRIAAVDGVKITLEEMGPWKPGARPIARVIELGPSTRVERVVRSPKAREWPGGFEATPLPASELRPGEFATVTVERHAGKLIAVAVTVVDAR